MAVVARSGNLAVPPVAAGASFVGEAQLRENPPVFRLGPARPPNRHCDRLLMRVQVNPLMSSLRADHEVAARLLAASSLPANSLLLSRFSRFFGTANPDTTQRQERQIVQS